MDDETREALAAMLRDTQQTQVIMWILQQCCIYGISFDYQTGQASAFREGERNVGLKIIAAIDAIDPTAYPRMLLARAAETINPVSKVNDD